jgi:hypothetical protein
VGRIRTVKPELFLDEDLFDLETKSRLPIRLSYTGLTTQADREGRFPWKPRTLKAAILPHDELDFEEVLNVIKDSGRVEKYTVDGLEFGWIRSFRRHQVINNRERASTLPKAPSDPHESTMPEVNSVEGLARGAAVGRVQRTRDAFRKAGQASAGIWPDASTTGAIPVTTHDMRRVIDGLRVLSDKTTRGARVPQGREGNKEGNKEGNGASHNPEEQNPNEEQKPNQREELVQELQQRVNEIEAQQHLEHLRDRSA